MTPKFAEAVDPVFLCSLDLLERLEGDTQPDPEAERAELRKWIDLAEARLGQSEQWLLAKYALVAWIDEILIMSRWTGQNYWTENNLELEYFGEKMAFDWYYEKARDATASPSTRDALEVYYLCVILGYRGLYRDTTTEKSIELVNKLGLPPDVDGWARQTAPALHLNADRPPIGGMMKLGAGAPPLEAKAHFVSYLLWAGILLTANVATIALLWF